MTVCLLIEKCHQRAGRPRRQVNDVVGVVVHVKSGESAPVANNASRAENLVISRQGVQRIRSVRETSTGNPAVGTGSSRGINIPSV